MKLSDLEMLKQSILDRINQGHSPAKRDGLFGLQETAMYYQINADMLAEIGHSSILSHEIAYDTIRRAQLFYDSVTPAEIEVLNAATRKCEHCHEAYTRDEFYEVRHAPGNGLVRILKWEMQAEWGTTVFCRHCTHLPAMPVFDGKHTGQVYLAVCDGLYKIGQSANSVKRMRGLLREYDSVELVCTVEVDNRYHGEAFLQTLMLHRHVERELFDLSPEDVEYIKGLAS